MLRTIVLLFVFLVPNVLAAQNLAVRPAFVEAQVPAGRNVVIPISIESLVGLDERTLDIDLIDLAQLSNGDFSPATAIVPANPDRSAGPWTSVPETVSVPTDGAVQLQVEIDVPTSARGTYATALLITPQRDADQTGLFITTRLMIPIILTIEGRPVPQDIRLVDADVLLFVEPDPSPTETIPDAERRRSTTIEVEIANEGGTYSRISGDIYLDHVVGDNDFRQVRYLPLPEMRILPGVSLSLPLDVDRRLPAGEYRIRGELFVDGRRTAPLRKVVSFAGDPEASNIAYDLPIALDPAVFEFDYVPGATRTGLIAVENPGFDPITVTFDVAAPEEMLGRASATVRGSDFSAAEWLVVAPESIVLRPGQRRNVRVQARFPHHDAEFANYYARVTLMARYADGSEAGVALGFVEVSRPGADDVSGAVLENVRFSESHVPLRLAMAAQVVNTGDVLLTPDVSYDVMDEGGAILSRGRLNDERSGEGITQGLLPLVARTFGGMLMLDGLADGDYLVRTAVSDGSRTLSTARHVVTVFGDSVSIERLEDGTQ